MLERKPRRQFCDVSVMSLPCRFTNKYGVLFEGVYGQPLVRKGATYEWDPAKCEANRGALVPWLEPPLLSVR